MLRVEMTDVGSVRTVKLLGRVSGEYAQYGRTLIEQCAGGGELVVDLNEVTFLDPTGEEVLLLLSQLGAVFMADNVYACYFCERVGLPLVRCAAGRRKSLRK